MKLLVFGLLFSFSISAYALKLRPHFEISEVKSKVDSLVPNPEIISWDRFFNSIIWINDSAFYFNPVGTLHLFQVTINDTVLVEKLSTSIFHGNTFGRYLFLKDNAPCMLGGQGLFSNLTGILKFDFLTHQWYEIKVKNLPQRYFQIAAAWPTENAILVLHFIADQPDVMVYGKIDLQTFEYSEYGVFRSDLRDIKAHSKNIVSRADGFTIMASGNSKGCFYIILNEKTGDLFEPSTWLETQCLNGKNGLYIQDSTLYEVDEFGAIDSLHLSDATFISQINLHQYYLEKIEANRPIEANFSWLWLLLGAGMVGFTALIIFNLKKSKSASPDVVDIPVNKEKPDIVYENLLEYEIRLTPLKGKIISKEALDKALNISTQTGDVIKVNRSRIIQMINANGQINIERVRDANDKRVYRYHVK